MDPGSDLARTGRQRALLTAVFKKLLTNQKLLLQTVLMLANGMNTENRASSMQGHVIKGTYHNAFGNWKFTFTDQDNRRAVIKQVYGVDVPELNS